MTDTPTGWGNIGRRLWAIVRYQVHDLKYWILRRQDPLDRPVASLEEEWEVWEEREAPARATGVGTYGTARMLGSEQARYPDGTTGDYGERWGAAIRQEMGPADRRFLRELEKETQKPLFFTKKGMAVAAGVVFLLAGGGMWMAAAHHPTPVATRKVFNSGEVLAAEDLNQAMSSYSGKAVHSRYLRLKITPGPSSTEDVVNVTTIRR